LTLRKVKISTRLPSGVLPNRAWEILTGGMAAQQQLLAETPAAAPQESQVEEPVEEHPASATASAATAGRNSLFIMSWATREL
jgi:hypothetical protein